VPVKRKGKEKKRRERKGKRCPSLFPSSPFLLCLK
jgi:hypothetical protein